MDIRKELLEQEMKRNIEKAKELQSEGRGQEAGEYYQKALSISKLIGEEKFNPEKENKVYGKLENGKEIESVIETLIVNQKPDTKWEDIGNLEEAKKTIRESIILPLIQNKPEFVKSAKTILLYGPPGTGKTLLAKAASNTLNANFFEAEASSLLSKYYGESSKLFSSLFKAAREKQPSIVFMDEIDSVVLSREGEMHEATRRVIGQVLSELDGFRTKKEDKVIFIGATNRPWDLDEAFLSRFERKIYVPLPDLEARKGIFKIHLAEVGIDGISFEDLSNKAGNFSGRDISNVCKGAIMGMVREQNPGLEGLTSIELNKYSLKYRKLSEKDFGWAFQKIKKPITKQDLERFEKWEEEFGG